MSGRYNLFFYCAIFVLYAVGLLAKPMLVTLPCVCLLLDFWPLGRFAVVLAAAPPPACAGRAAGAARGERPSETSACRPGRRRPPQSRNGERSLAKQALLLVLEKFPLLALSAISAVITPYAQNHGGSMASPQELSITFRIENCRNRT